MHRVRSITVSGKTFSLRIKTGTVGYNNKILVSDGNFSLGKMMRLMKRQK